MARHVLVLTASYGTGHLRAAENLCDAMRREGFTNFVTCDVLRYAQWPRGHRLRALWQRLSTNHKFVYGLLYSPLMRSGLHRWLCELMAPFISAELLRDLRHIPDRIVAMHSFAAVVGCHLKARTRARLIVVATDFLLTATHISDSVDTYCVPPAYITLAGAAGTLTARDRAVTTGLPISVAFDHLPTRELARQQLELGTAERAIVCSFGGSALHTRTKRFIEQVFSNVNSVATPLVFAPPHSALRRIAERISGVRLMDNGEMPLAVAAADGFVGKAGGLSLSEALANSLPIALVDALPGQERLNAKIATAVYGAKKLTPDELRIWVSSLGEKSDDLVDATVFRQGSRAVAKVTLN